MYTNLQCVFDQTWDDVQSIFLQNSEYNTASAVLLFGFNGPFLSIAIMLLFSVTSVREFCLLPVKINDNCLTNPL